MTGPHPKRFHKLFGVLEGDWGWAAIHRIPYGNITAIRVDNDHQALKKWISLFKTEPLATQVLMHNILIMSVIQTDSLLLSAAAHLGHIQVLKTPKTGRQEQERGRGTSENWKPEYEGGNKRISLLMQ